MPLCIIAYNIFYDHFYVDIDKSNKANRLSFSVFIGSFRIFKQFYSVFVSI